MAIQLTAATRELGTKGDVNSLRGENKIPAVVYGHGIKNQCIALEYNEFETVFEKAGTSSLVEVAIDKEKVIPSLVSEVQKDPVTHKFTHVDLHAVNMNEKIKAEVPINFIGESPAVKTLGGNLIITKDSINIECLPKDLISSIEVDLSVLKELDDAVHVGELNINDSVTVLDDSMTNLATVLAPRIEKEETPEESVEGEVAEGEEKEKKEGSEDNKEESTDNDGKEDKKE